MQHQRLLKLIYVIAQEQEMKAKVAQNRAQLVLAEGEVPKAMAAALVHALRVMEDNGDMVETVKAMLELDEGLVSKLEFVIGSAFVEKGLPVFEGGRYAY